MGDFKARFIGDSRIKIGRPRNYGKLNICLGVTLPYGFSMIFQEVCDTAQP
jgi:hypothetical protein